MFVSSSFFVSYSYLNGFWPWRTLNSDSGDESQSTLSPDEQVLQVVAGVVLLQRDLESVEDGASLLSQNHLNAEDIGLEAAVANQPQASCVQRE